MKTEYTNTGICCTAQSKSEALELAEPNVEIIVCLLHRKYRYELVRIPESFCVGDSGAVLLPLEVPSTKSTERKEVFLLIDNTSKLTELRGERRGNWSGWVGTIM
jgi:hypothetical protein